MSSQYGAPNGKYQPSNTSNVRFVGLVALKSFHGKYVTADANGTIRDASKIQDWEVFEWYLSADVHDQKDIRLRSAFRSHAHGTWITILPDGGKLVGDRQKQGDWETFELFQFANNSSRYGLKGSHGKFLNAEPSGSVAANRDKTGEWEQWEILPLQGHNPASASTALTLISGAVLTGLAAQPGQLFQVAASTASSHDNTKLKFVFHLPIAP